MPYRVLSLSGGGMRGIFQAQVLPFPKAASRAALVHLSFRGRASGLRWYVFRSHLCG
jgi:hypothetical protein